VLDLALVWIHAVAFAGVLSGVVALL